MKTKILFLLGVGFIFWVQAKAQQIEPCGTTQYFENIKAKDPTIVSRMDSIEQVIQEWIKTNKPYYYKMQVTYPNIPDFEPTGNIYTDEANYAKAKKELYENNPDEYKEWVEKMKRDTVINKKIEVLREKEKQQKLKNK